MTDILEFTLDPQIVMIVGLGIATAIQTIVLIILGRKQKAVEAVLGYVATVNGYTDYKAFLKENAKKICPDCNSEEDTNHAIDTLVNSLARLRK